MKIKEQKVNDSLLTLLSHHKRLQFIEKRLQTYAQLVKSERVSYIEKYKQQLKNKKLIHHVEVENNELHLKIKEMTRVIEEKELANISLKHEVKLEKDSYQKLSQSRMEDTNKSIEEGVQKVKDIESINQAMRTDNDRLIYRIKELERENISLKTDIATHDTLKRTDIDNLTMKLHHSLQQKDLKIQDLNMNVKELDNSNQQLVQQLKLMKDNVTESE